MFWNDARPRECDRARRQVSKEISTRVSRCLDENSNSDLYQTATCRAGAEVDLFHLRDRVLESEPRGERRVCVEPVQQRPHARCQRDLGPTTVAICVTRSFPGTIWTIESSNATRAQVTWLFQNTQRSSRSLVHPSRQHSQKPTRILNREPCRWTLSATRSAHASAADRAIGAIMVASRSNKPPPAWHRRDALHTHTHTSKALSLSLSLQTDQRAPRGEEGDARKCCFSTTRSCFEPPTTFGEGPPKSTRLLLLLLKRVHSPSKAWSCSG